MLLDENYKTNDYNDFIKNNNINEAKLIIKRWFIELGLMKITHDCIEEPFEHLEKDSEELKTQETMYGFYLYSGFAYLLFKKENDDAKFLDNSDERVVSRYCNFLKNNSDYFFWVKQRDYKKAKLIAEVYCKELKKMSESTPLDMIFKTLNKEKLK